MGKCSGWEFSPYYGGICKGTKEQEPCRCNGDESKCDFYETVRANVSKHETNNETKLKCEDISAIDFINQKARFCKTYDICKECPLFLENESCDEWINNHPNLAIEKIMTWAAEHPEPITWNKWLHYVYDYCRGFSGNLSFIEWLNKPIPADMKAKYNIPEVLK